MKQCHCELHQEAVCVKLIDFQRVMTVVTSVVNFIRYWGLKHRNFQEHGHSVPHRSSMAEPWECSESLPSCSESTSLLSWAKKGSKCWKLSSGHAIWHSSHRFSHPNALNNAFRRKYDPISDVLSTCFVFKLKLSLLESGA